MSPACVVFLLVLHLSVSCNHAAGQTVAGKPFDQYFVESKDIVSKYGPDHITREMLQDKRGNIWFATWKGIVRYDGTYFTNYTLKEDLIRFHVFSCYQDKKGNLWFGMPRGGVYRYDGKSFKLLTTEDGLGGNSVECIREDNNGNIWFATDYGATKYDGKTFMNFTSANGLCYDYVSAIMVDKKGQLWFGTQRGISIYDGKSFRTFNDNAGRSLGNITSLLEDKKGNIWIGKMDGLTVYDGKSITNYLADRLTYYIIQDTQGNIWFTHSEVNKFDSTIPNQVLYKYDGKSFIKVDEKHGGNDFQIFGKMVDNAGNLWFGTMHGPCKYDGKSFTYFNR